MMDHGGEKGGDRLFGEVEWPGVDAHLIVGVNVDQHPFAVKFAEPQIRATDPKTLEIIGAEGQEQGSIGQKLPPEIVGAGAKKTKRDIGHLDIPWGYA